MQQRNRAHAALDAAHASGACSSGCRRSAIKAAAAAVGEGCIHCGQSDALPARARCWYLERCVSDTTDGSRGLCDAHAGDAIDCSGQRQHAGAGAGGAQAEEAAGDCWYSGRECCCCGHAAREGDVGGEARLLQRDAQAAGGGAEEGGAEGEGVRNVLAAGGCRQQRAAHEDGGGCNVIARVAACCGAAGDEGQLELVVACSSEQRQAVAVDEHAA